MASETGEYVMFVYHARRGDDALARRISDFKARGIRDYVGAGMSISRAVSIRQADTRYLEWWADLDLLPVTAVGNLGYPAIPSGRFVDVYAHEMVHAHEMAHLIYEAGPERSANLDPAMRDELARAEHQRRMEFLEAEHQQRLKLQRIEHRRRLALLASEAARASRPASENPPSRHRVVESVPPATVGSIRLRSPRHRDAGRFAYMAGLVGAILFMAVGLGPGWIGFAVAFLPASALAAWVVSVNV